MKQLKQLEKTIEQKVSELNKEGAETLEALLTTNTLSEAAEKMKLARNTLYARIDKYGLEELISVIKTKAIMTLTQDSVDAAENLINKIGSKDDKTSLAASTETLDRIGIVKPQTSGGVNINFNNHALNQRGDYGL